MFFGFLFEDGEASELVPAIFKQLSLVDRHKIFITQYNAAVACELKIRVDSLTKSESLLDIFVNKIYSLINDKSLIYCDLSVYLIDSFLQNKTYMLNTCFAKVPIHPAAKLIQMIWCKEDQGLYFKSSWLFCNYVYEKISKCHQDKDVMYKDGLIVVSKYQEDLVAVMPSFKYVCMNQPQLADKEIKRAYRILEQRDVKKFYIAFPKHKNFKRHIVVKYGNSDNSSKLTLVPYAISHKIVYNKNRVSNFK